MKTILVNDGNYGHIFCKVHFHFYTAFTFMIIYIFIFLERVICGLWGFDGCEVAFLLASWWIFGRVTYGPYA